MLTGAAWWVGAQFVTLHIFAEAAYAPPEGAADACACGPDNPPPDRGSVAFDFCLLCDDKWKVRPHSRDARRPCSSADPKMIPLLHL